MRAFFITVFWLSAAACKDNIAQPLLSNVDNPEYAYDTFFSASLSTKLLAIATMTYLISLEQQTKAHNV